MADLRLIEVGVTNFRSFTGEHVIRLNRAPGVYFIRGENKLTGEANGSGKSTLFVDSLLWAFFGVLEDDARPGASVVPWGSSAKPEVFVRFDVGSEKHTLCRARGSLRLDDEEITGDRVQKVIGISEGLFRRSFLLGQFGRLFLDLRPEEQTGLFNEAVDVSKLIRASTSASVEAKATAAEVARLTQERTRLDGESSAIRTQLKSEKERAGDWDKSQAAVVKRCSSDLLTARKELADYTVRRPAVTVTISSDTDLVRRKRKLETDFALARGEYERLSDVLRTLVAKGEHCPTCGQSWPDVSSHRAKVDEVRERVTQAKEVRESVAKSLAKVDRLLQEEEADHRKQIAALSVWEGTKQELEKKVARLEDRLADEKQKTNPYEISVKDLKARKQELDASLVALDELLNAAKVRMDAAMRWAEGFRTIRLDVIDSVTDELAEAVNRHMVALGLSDWRIEFATERETQSGTVSLGFNASVYPPGLASPVRWKAYSGGERQRMHLAMTFGLNEVLLARAGISPNIEIYDEPSKGLSPQGLAALIEYLAERAEKLERAVYLVDHHSLKSGAFREVITVQKDEKGSRVVL